MRVTPSKKVVASLMMTIGLFILSSVVHAEEKAAGSVSFWEKTKVTGTADVNYNYNLNRPTTTAAAVAKNAYRVFDANANTFNIGLVELAIENAPTDWVTFRTDLDFGNDASLIHAAGFGIATDIFDLQQAYVALKAASVGSGLTFKIGKFVTMHGAEVIEASANNNISRSLLFNYAIPFTHTGIMASYSFADWIALDLGVVNGWNNVVDNNNGKSIHGMFTIKPVDKVTWTLSGTVGPETAGSDGKIRTLIDTVLTYAPNDMWTVAVNYDLGRDKGLAGPATAGVADWQGFAGYVHVKPFDFFGLSARGEYFRDDKAGTVGGGMTAGAATGAALSTRLYEGTLTSHFYLADGLDLRFEYRHDHGNAASFLKGTGVSRTFQNTLASQLVYAF